MDKCTGHRNITVQNNVENGVKTHKINQKNQSNANIYYSLPKDNILNLAKLKAFTDNKFKVA